MIERKPLSAETRKRIGAGVRRAYAAGLGPHINKWKPPEDLLDMYRSLLKFGAREAKRLILDHMEKKGRSK